MPKSKKKIVLGLGILLVLILLFGAGLFYYYFLMPWYMAPGFNHPFDAQQWQKEKGNTKQDNPRGRMVRSLLRSHTLNGKSKEEIITLLGQPDWTSSNDIPLTKVQEFDYEVGWYSGFRIDPDYLAIYFDKDGKVIKYAVQQG
jgi:hypothetical protein